MEKRQILKDADIQIHTSMDAARVLYQAFAGLDHEESWTMYLNNKNRFLGAEMITCGTLTSTLIDRRRIVKNAILRDATAIILYHNHPSGEPTPSIEDIKETEDLRNACGFFDISLIDHIIFGERSFFSFADETKKTIKL